MPPPHPAPEALAGPGPRPAAARRFAGRRGLGERGGGPGRAARRSRRRYVADTDASMCDFEDPPPPPPKADPKIRIECATSGRSGCKCVNPKREDLKRFSCPGGEAKSISQGSLRCGVWNSDLKTYWQWKVSVCPACGLAPGWLRLTCGSRPRSTSSGEYMRPPRREERRTD